MPSALKASEYKSLLEQIDGIYTRAQGESARALNRILTRAYWEIGKRIVTVEQKNNIRAQYGEALLEQISKYLTRKYGNGFSPVNLSNMRRFYLAYPIFQTSEKLQWSHYQLLSTIADNAAREAYEKKAIKKGWNVRELAAFLREDRVKRLSLNGRRTLTPKPHAPIPKLNAQRGRLYTYKVEEVTAEAVFVDCGFNMIRKVVRRGRGAGKLAAGDMIGSAARNGTYTLTPLKETESALYTYKAQVRKITDADTPWVKIDAGFDTFTRRKLRLRGIDAPEINTAAGRRAKRFVEKLLKPCPFIIVKTYKDQSDKYDRYLVDIYFLAGESDPARIAAEGELLNQRLLDEGLAVRYEE